MVDLMEPVEGEKRIQIMELFGPTIQGEGFMTGTITHFLRTGGCPLRCSWCDSLFAVMPAEILEHRTLMTTWEIIDAIHALPWAPYVTLTGGDPCIQTRLGDIIPAINANKMRVAVETQGMYFPVWLQECDVITFSPKGPSSGNVVDPLPMADYILSLGLRRKMHMCIKVVVFNEEDFNYAMSIYELLPPSLYDSFYFTAGTPMGLETLEERTLAVIHNEQELAKLVLAATPGIRLNDKVHLGCQQHVLLWPDKDKGV